MPIYHGLYVSLWTILPSLFLLISLLIFKSNILNFLVTPYLSESIISLGLDEIIYVKSFLINNISNLTSLVESEFLSKDMAYSLNEKYYLGRLIIFSSLISLSLIFSLITYRNLSIRFDARRKVEAIFKFSHKSPKFHNAIRKHTFIQTNKIFYLDFIKEESSVEDSIMRNSRWIPGLRERLRMIA